MGEPRLFVAGAGAAATTIARAAQRAGWPVGEVACRTGERAVARVALVGAGTPVDFATLCAPERSAGDGPVLLLVGVPDRAIEAVARSLAGRAWPEGSLALHLSGSVEVDALDALSVAGLAIGGLHPLKSFVDPVRDAATLAGTVAAIEGDGAAVEVAERLARALGLASFRLAPGARPAWHAAASHACNHFVALVDQALDLAESAGLAREQARAALVPLLRGTLDHLADREPSAALTGPIARGDLGAVLRHLTALDGMAADVAAGYRALARRAVRLARSRRSLDEDTAAALLDALRDAPS